MTNDSEVSKPQITLDASKVLKLAGASAGTAMVGTKPGGLAVKPQDGKDCK